MDNGIEILKDCKGNSIVKINNFIFKGKQNIDWKAVEAYLQRYVGKIVDVSLERINIEGEFPNEYTGSVYTKKLRGGLAKAKATAAQGIIELLKVAVLKNTMENKKNKHKKRAKYGWKYYETRFALPVYDEQTKQISYNVYRATLVIALSIDGRMYLVSAD